MFTAFPESTYHECPALALAKLYANTMVTTLNNRAFLKRMRPSAAPTTISLQGSAVFASDAPRYPGYSTGNTSTQVNSLGPFSSDIPLKGASVSVLVFQCLMTALMPTVDHRRSQSETWTLMS